MLDIGAGDEEEHAVMLYNMLYYLALKDSGEIITTMSRKLWGAVYIELGEDRVQPEGCIREWEEEREWWRQRERERGREREKEAEIDGSEFSFYSSDFTMQPTPIMTTQSIDTCIIPAHVPFTSFSSYFQYRGVNFIHRSLNISSPSSSPSPSPSFSPSPSISFHLWPQLTSL